MLATGTLIAAAGITAGLADATPPPDNFGGLPSALTLTGVVRDMRERSVTGGHPDFERQPTAGFAQYTKMVADSLDENGKPVMRSTGNRLSSDWRDAAGRNRIDNRSYINSRTGDTNGSAATSAGGALTSAENLAMWFSDTPGVNLSQPLALTLQRNAGTNVYTFNDRTDARFSGLGGFFPINGELFGNSRNNSQNFHFTFELETEFIFERGSGQVFTFTGDDDVWVYVDGKLVIDIGGVHSAKSQSIDLDRLAWLQNGRSYKLKFFFAERHRTASNFRIDTTLRLRTVQAPTTTHLYD